jgi:hypothetical protein
MRWKALTNSFRNLFKVLKNVENIWKFMKMSEKLCRVWKALKGFEKLCDVLKSCENLWKPLNRFELLWIALTCFELFWKALNLFELLRIALNPSQRKLTALKRVESWTKKMKWKVCKEQKRKTLKICVWIDCNCLKLLWSALNCFENSSASILIVANVHELQRKAPNLKA